MNAFSSPAVRPRRVLPLLLPLALLVLAGCSSGRKLALQEGDRIAIVGNALAERFQHDGWLEAYLQAAHPGHQLVFRNLGYSGDQVHYRPRAHEGFGNGDTHLANIRANVIFAFFGYNESFADQPAEFKQQLSAWIDHLRAQKYDGVNAPRLVLFSPIAHENLHTRNLPDGAENNRRLAAYTQAMEEVAKAKDVPFVNLFSATQDLYAAAAQPLTINGVHLGAEGNRQVARYLTENVFKRPVSLDEAKLEALRRAVVEKDEYWFARYRATSGNDVWGSRSSQDGNLATLQRELKMLEAMTANRDPQVWARAQGGDLAVDDSKVPEPLIVGTHITREVTYLDPQKAIEKMSVPDDLQVNLFAAEDRFPEIANPVAMQVDTRGRIWVASWANYPKWEPGRPMNDRLVVLTDEDGDGVADKSTTFAYVSHPTGFEFWNDGVIVVSAPDILYLKDTDGDGVADVRIRLFGGIGSDDTHHTANNLVYGPDGYIYYQRGIFILENVETPWRVSEESGTSGVYRFNPRTFDFSFVVENTPNPHGVSFDKWGHLFITDGTSGKAFQVYHDRKVTSTSDVDRFEKRPLFTATVRPVTASMVLSSAHFPEEYQNNFLVLNVIGFQGIKRYHLDYQAQGVVAGREAPNLLFTGDNPEFKPRSEAAPRVVTPDFRGDPNFRPTDAVVGFDGALYFSDWQNAVITHSPYNLRDASRDQTHGRIYRITAKNRPLQKPVAVHGEPIERLLDLFRHPVDGIRHQARVELSGRATDEVLANAREWARQLKPTKEDALPLLEILWLHQQHNVPNRELLLQALKSPEEQVRIAAQKVAWAWSERNSHFRGGTGSDVSGMKFRTFYEPFWNPPESAQPAAGHAGHAAAPAAAAPAPAAKALDQKLDLRAQAVAILKVEAVQMQFNVTEFTVKPGQRVELTLDNVDLMPHNLLIVAPGAADEVARLAVDLGEKGWEKHYVPESGKVLHATRLLDAQKKETLKFTAPVEPGEYPFVCTFPGHAAIMRGVMKVVR